MLMLYCLTMCELELLCFRHWRCVDEEFGTIMLMAFVLTTSTLLQSSDASWLIACGPKIRVLQ